jgi:hypothetical protein
MEDLSFIITQKQIQIMDIIFESQKNAKKIRLIDIYRRLPDYKKVTNQAFRSRIGFLEKHGMVILDKSDKEQYVYPTLLAYKLLKSDFKS